MTNARPHPTPASGPIDEPPPQPGPTALTGTRPPADAERDAAAPRDPHPTDEEVAMTMSARCPACAQPARRPTREERRIHLIWPPLLWVHTETGDPLCLAMGPLGVTPSLPLLPPGTALIDTDRLGSWLDGSDAGTYLAMIDIARGYGMATPNTLAALERYVGAQPEHDEDHADVRYLLLRRHAEDALAYLNRLCAPSLQFVSPTGCSSCPSVNTPVERPTHPPRAEPVRELPL